MAKQPFKDDTLLARWLSGALSPQEEAALRQRADFADYQRLVTSLNQLQPPLFDTDEQFKRLTATRTAPSPNTLHPRPRLLKRFQPWLAAAATLTLLFFAWLLWPNTQPYQVANGQPVRTTELPDGSSVRLNTGTELDFDVTDQNRLATLEGEAFFDVVKSDVPFIVATPRGRVTVVGTSFNVFSRDDLMTVTCASGQVRVSFTGLAEAYPLRPGEEVSIDAAGQVTTSKMGNPESLDWLTGKSVFINRPLADILAEMERQFDLDIRIPAGLDVTKKYNATFPNDDATVALGSVLNTLEGYTYQRDGRTVTLLATE